MSGVNPVVLIQLLMQYHYNPQTKDPRIFSFTRNNRLRIHRETSEETAKRKSLLDATTIRLAEGSLQESLKKALKGKVGRVYVDPKMAKIAVPLQMSVSENGFGVLPTGSRIDIPNGKIIRAFTYWEKVNDIDLSCFAITTDGRQKEFSWRNMWHQQSEAITFSGDQTSGYHGGSEYFDIDIDRFKNDHPDFRYIVCCNNVYSGVDFSECICKAGFMIRETNPEDVPMWKGEQFIEPRGNGKIFDPSTVMTSFRINAKTTYAYLFAIDLETREMVWLNMADASRTRVAGTKSMDVLLRYLTVTDVFNVHDLYTWAASVVVDDPFYADILVTDDNSIMHHPSTEVVHSWDFEKMLRLLRA